MTISTRLVPLAAAWAAFGVAQGLIRNASNLSAATLLQILAFDVPLALLWAGFTPLVGAWDRAVARRTSSAATRVTAHLPVLAVLAVAHTAARRGLALALGGTVAVPFEVTLLYFVDVLVASYLVAAWTARTLEAERERSARARHTEALRTQLAAAQMQYLDLQLKPHFLFNALGAISELAHEAPDRAARMLRNVGQLLEAAASRPERALVTLQEELEALQPYLEIQRLRFEDWLTIEETVDDEARMALVPPFILQPLVENAVHHGLTNRTERGRIAVEAHRRGDRLVIEVVDNGVGLAGPRYQERRGMGLANVRSRLTALHGYHATLELQDRGPRGTAACLDLPFTTDAPASADALPGQPPAPSPRAPRFTELTGLRLALALVAAWGVVALFRIQHSLAYLVQRDALTLQSLVSALRFDLAVAAIWLLLTPIVFVVLRAVPLRRDGAVWRAAAHVVAAVAVALLHAAATPLLLSGFDVSAWAGPLRELFAWNVAIYAILLVLLHLRDIHRWTEARNAIDRQLRHALESARFQRVMLELRPVVLLKALRSLETLVSRDAVRAEAVLADVADFLRGTLDAMQESRVTLRREADAVRSYARLMAAGIAPQLMLRVSAESSLLERFVPNGVLRALLDAVSGEGEEPVTLTIDLTSDGAGIIASAVSGSRAPVPGAQERLEAYERRGLVALARDSHAVTVRIPDESAPHAGTGSGRQSEGLALSA